MIDDETQHPSAQRRFERGSRLRTWMRKLTGAAAREAVRDAQQERASDRFNVHDTLRALPTLLDKAGLPDGVVELLIEDFEAPISQLFDIHDGRVRLVEPGECVPWASIAGPETAWAMALGPQRDATRLQLIGDKPLARRVLAALPRQG